MFEPIRQARAQPRPRWPLIVGVVALAFLTLAGLVMLGAAASAKRARDAEQVRIALTEIRATMDRLGHAGANPAVIDMRVKATGVAGQAEGVVKQYAALVAGDKRAYVAELTALGFPAALQARNLAHENLGAVHADLVEARGVVAKYRTLNEKRVAAYRTAFANIDLTDAQREAFESSFAVSETQNQALRSRLWGYEDALLAEFDQVVTLLERTRGQWMFDGRMLRFRNPVLTVAYNGHIASARQMAAEEQALMRQAVQGADDKFDTLISQAN